ncbi:MAG: hypothetical protein AAGA56_06800 [Myxococcota bacterium]
MKERCVVRRGSWALVCLVLPALTACGDGGEASATMNATTASSSTGSAGPGAGGGNTSGGVVADFSLRDVNATSASFDQPVSPRDYLDRVSAWYFAEAT